MTQPYRLTWSAANDLRGIVRYTVEQWGEARCRAYVAQIEHERMDLMVRLKGRLQ